MLTKITRFKLGLLVLIVALVGGYALSAVASHATPPTVGVVCENDASATPVFDLETTTGYISVPDGNSILMWSYVLNADSGSIDPFQTPGPVLCVEQGAQVTVNLTNNLPEPTSIIFPGQSGVTASGGSPGLLAQEAAASGGAVSYSFIASEPGTYLYESGSLPDKQVQMGLYGVIIVRPDLNNGTNFYAYNDVTTEYDHDREFLLVLHEIDPDIHLAVERAEPYDITAFHAHYWTINGRAFPDVIAQNFAPWLPGQPYGGLVQVEAQDPDNPGLPALIRYANASMDNHPFHPHGNHLRVIARDSRRLLTPSGDDGSMEAFTKTIGSGQTYDLLFRWLDLEGFSSTGNSFETTIPDVLPYPSLQNLVFKDDYTWYSGSPYLGETADFQPAVTINNECGEFYFPWHSHALNEFQNFDEGFGGLSTLLRVDPPGGCP
jgi:FtsP/CotA-like multicopper oxidase with cupredoxin domain